LSALNHLGAENVDELYILGLQDSNAKVRNICVSILQTNYGHLRAELESLLRNGELKAQKSSLRILVHYGALNSLQNILFALTDINKELQTAAWHHLVSWHNQYAQRLWFSFDKATYNEIVKLLDKLEEISIDPPCYAQNSWNDLPNIIKFLRQ